MGIETTNFQKAFSCRTEKGNVTSTVMSNVGSGCCTVGYSGKLFTGLESTATRQTLLSLACENHYIRFEKKNSLNNLNINHVSNLTCIFDGDLRWVPNFE